MIWLIFFLAKIKKISFKTLKNGLILKIMLSYFSARNCWILKLKISKNFAIFNFQKNDIDRKKEFQIMLKKIKINKKKDPKLSRKYCWAFIKNSFIPYTYFQEQDIFVDKFPINHPVFLRPQLFFFLSFSLNCAKISFFFIFVFDCKSTAQKVLFCMHSKISLY